MRSGLMRRGRTCGPRRDRCRPLRSGSASPSLWSRTRVRCLNRKKKSLSFTTAFKNIERKILDDGNKNLNTTMTVSSQGNKERVMSPGDVFAHSSDGRRPDAVALHLNKGQENFDRLSDKINLEEYVIRECPCVCVRG